MNTSYDKLVDLLETIERLLKPLAIYTRIQPTPYMDEIVVKIVVELLSILALTTKELKQGRPSESVPADVLSYSMLFSERLVKKIFGERDADAILRRLDRLSYDEARMTAAEILKVVYGLVQDTSE